jgi:hypothetical protein
MLPIFVVLNSVIYFKFQLILNYPFFPQSLFKLLTILLSIHFIILPYHFIQSCLILSLNPHSSTHHYYLSILYYLIHSNPPHHPILSYLLSLLSIPYSSNFYPNLYSLSPPYHSYFVHLISFSFFFFYTIYTNLSLFLLLWHYQILCQ